MFKRNWRSAFQHYLLFSSWGILIARHLIRTLGRACTARFFAFVLLSASKFRPSHFVEIESYPTTCIVPRRLTLSLAQPDAIFDQVLPDGNLARQALSVLA